MSKKKSPITMCLDPEMLAWYKAQSPRYQLLMQDVLHHHMTKTKHPLPGETPMPKTTKRDQAIDILPVDVDETKVPESFSPMEKFVEVSDVRVGKIRLEKIRQSLYDHQVQRSIFDIPEQRREEHLRTPSEIVFFADPGGRSVAYTNVETAGSLTWPKRFYIDGLRISISQIVDVSEAYASLRVGEKTYLNLPLSNMERDDDEPLDLKNCPVLPRMRFKYLGINPAIFIPPVQYFGVVLGTGKKSFGSAEIRVQLEGTLLRKIC